jgi:hypothetical protein
MTPSRIANVIAVSCCANVCVYTLLTGCRILPPLLFIRRRIDGKLFTSSATLRFFLARKTEKVATIFGWGLSSVIGRDEG